MSDRGNSRLALILKMSFSKKNQWLKYGFSALFLDLTRQEYLIFILEQMRRVFNAR